MDVARLKQAIQQALDAKCGHEAERLHKSDSAAYGFMLHK